MFKELEEAWSQDSGGYDEMIKEQLADKKGSSLLDGRAETSTGK